MDAANPALPTVGTVGTKQQHECNTFSRLGGPQLVIAVGVQGAGVALSGGSCWLRVFFGGEGDRCV